MEPSIPSLIEETKNLWNQGRKVMIQVAWNLKKIQDSGEWEGETFPKWAEAELDISQSQTSKLLTVANYFLREKTPEEIGPVAYESLYMATMLPGTVDENLAKAKTLTRLELKQELNESEPHPGEFIEVCRHCYVKRENHN